MTSKRTQDPETALVPTDPAEGVSRPGLRRRTFLKVLGAAGVGATQASRATAQESASDEDPVGILIDTTYCAGCRTCEFTCAEAHGLPGPDPDFSVFEQERTTSETQWTLVNEYETDAGMVYAKRQCMHCLQPACASACLTKAMLKTEEGPVVWRGSKCMGCRFWMVSCPFDVPKFEYHSANPKIQKCNMCVERREQGLVPACVENCPAEALLFGKRSELIDEAYRRIYESPDQYVHEIYGEHDAGGTTVLYLSSVPFEQIGLKSNLGTDPYPELTKEFLYGVPVVLTLVPAFLLAVSNATKRNNEDEGDGASHGSL